MKKLRRVEEELRYRIKICECLAAYGKSPDTAARLVGYQELLRFVEKLRDE